MRTRRHARIVDEDDEVDSSFVVGDDVVEYVSQPISIADSMDTDIDIQETVVDDQDEDEEDELLYSTTPFERFKRAVCSSESDWSTLFFSDIVATKLRPALIRGNVMTRERLDELVIFLSKRNVEKKALEPIKSTCDICKMKKVVSFIFSNGEKHFVAGSYCADMMTSAITALDKYDSLRSECTTFMERKFEEFNRLNNGDVDVRYSGR